MRIQSILGTCVAPLLLAACAKSDRVGTTAATAGTGASSGEGEGEGEAGSGEAGTGSGSGSATATGSGSDTGATTATTSGSGTTASTSATSGTSDSSTGGDSDGVRFDIGGSGDLTAGSATVGESGGGQGCEFLDILFVVDISGSMMQEHANLAANFPNFVQVLDDYVENPAKSASGYRIGVTNSTIVDNGDPLNQSTTGLDGSLADSGAFGNDCGMAGKRWIDGPAPDVSDKFTCVANSPQSDCSSCTDNGKERPLNAIEMFIDKHAPGGYNEGFYRGDASLLVIVNLTDEDDDVMFSTTQPAAAKAKIDAFARGEERYVLVTISGPQSGGCTSAFGEAAPAPRLHEFTNLAPNSVMGDICEGDLSAPLAEALELIQISCDVLPPPVG